MKPSLFNPRIQRVLLLVLGLAAAYVLQQAPLGPTALNDAGAAISARAAADDLIATAYATKQSNLWVESQGQIERVLADDQQGARHQRLIVRLADGQSVLIAHNIDIAARIPQPQPGETLAFRGEYEWNPQGGVVHWTHHDPDQRRPGGWLEYAGQRYR